MNLPCVSPLLILSHDSVDPSDLIQPYFFQVSTDLFCFLPHMHMYLYTQAHTQYPPEPIVPGSHNPPSGTFISLMQSQRKSMGPFHQVASYFSPLMSLISFPCLITLLVPPKVVTMDILFYF